MLPNEYIERVQQLLSPMVEQWRMEVSDKFLLKSNEAAAIGNSQSGWFIKELTRISTEAIQNHVRTVWQIERRVLSVQAIPYTPTLAADLKAHIEELVPTHCWKLIESWPKINMPELLERQRGVLLGARSLALQQAFGEVDLFIDELKNRNSSQMQSDKEIEQDFKILFSRDQAKTDFEDTRRVLENGSQIALFFVDLDNFKGLNTRYGHTTVDQSFLPETMVLLAKLTKLRGGAYRYGGDEYLVLLPNCDTLEAANFAERVRSAYANQEFKIREDKVPLTVSIGLGLWPIHGSSYDEVLGRANDALLEAKHKKNCVVMAGTRSSTVIPYSGLSFQTQKLAAHLNLKSQNGLEHDPIEDADNLERLLDLSPEALGAAANELEEKGWIKLLKTFGMGRSGFTSLWATPKLFINSDHILKGWSAKSDAKTIAQSLEKENDQSSSLAKLDEKLAFGPRRLNPAIAYLIENEYVLDSKTMGSDPYISNWIRAKPKLWRLLSNE